MLNFLCSVGNFGTYSIYTPTQKVLFLCSVGLPEQENGDLNRCLDYLWKYCRVQSWSLDRLQLEVIWNWLKLDG